MRARKRGFTLTEIAIVLGVIGTILGAIWSAASHVSNNQEANKANTQILGIVQSIRSLYGPKPYFPGAETDATPQLMNTGAVFGSDMIVSGQTHPVNPFGGSVAVYTSIVSSTTFRVSYYNVTAAQCNQVADSIATQSASASAPLSLITACGATVTNLTTTPLDPLGIESVCNANTGAACQSVEFDFSL